MKVKTITPKSETIAAKQPTTFFERLHRLVFGSPVASRQIKQTLVGKFLALPVFCSDAISSVAYGGQQIILVLCAAGLWLPDVRQQYSLYTMGISWAIALLLAIVAASYRQTVHAYPGGGGSYLVSRENLGIFPGLIAAAALLIDYVLTVSVSVSSGLQNLKDVPDFMTLGIGHHLVAYCTGAIAILSLANLRGLKQSGRLFAVPTYTFIFMCYLLILIGLTGQFFGWHFHKEYANQLMPGTLERSAWHAVGLLVILRAFANGCSALTGVEAISNGVPALKEPKSHNASVVLIAVGIILGTVFLGVAWLSMHFHVVYWEHDGISAPAVIDQLSGTIFGKSGSSAWLYLIMQLSTALVLVVAAQTSFAGFPRLASILAADGFLPRQLTALGDKLAFNNGIILLGFCSSALIVLSKGSVDRLIPFFAIGVFSAFTMSQTGMVRHWMKNKGRGWRSKACVNGLGALACFIVVLDIAIEKFMDGAWLVLVIGALLMMVFKRIHTHYTDLAIRLDPKAFQPPVAIKNKVLVLVSELNAGTLAALAYAKSISREFSAVHVEVNPKQTPLLEKTWKKYAPSVPLVILKSPYRSMISPLLCYLDEVHEQRPDCRITVLVGEFVPGKWWTRLLHGNTALMLHLSLLGRNDVIISNVRYWLDNNDAGNSA